MNLNQNDIDAITSQLKNRLDELSGGISSNLSNISHSGVRERGGNDSGDESNQELETILSVGRAGRETYEISLLEGALSRLENGTFGECLSCGDSIERQRLLANPIAKRCLNCQDRHEDNQDERDRTPSI